MSSVTLRITISSGIINEAENALKEMSEEAYDEKLNPGLSRRQRGELALRLFLEHRILRNRKTKAKILADVNVTKLSKNSIVTG